MSTREGHRRAAEHALAAIRSDPSLARRVAASYSGRHALTDVLWWVAYPGSVAPSGIADPAGELRNARAHAFSREGQSTDWVEVRNPVTGETVRMRQAEARVVDLERQAAAEAAAIEAVLAVIANANANANAGAGAGIHPSGPSGSTGPIGQNGSINATGAMEHPGRSDSSDSSDPSASEHGAPASGAGRRRRRYVLPAALVAAGLLVGVALSTAVFGELGWYGIDVATEAEPSGQPLGSGPPRAVGVFEREATEADVLPSEFVGTTEITGRQLYSDGSLKVWAYRDGGQICLFYMDGFAAGGTCTPPGVFATDGITLPLPDTGVIMSTRTSGSLLPALTELTWAPDGAIVIHAIPLLQ